MSGWTPQDVIALIVALPALIIALKGMWGKASHDEAQQYAKDEAGKVNNASLDRFHQLNKSIDKLSGEQ